MEDRIGTSRRPCRMCASYTQSILWYLECAQSSGEFRGDWAIPRMLPVGGSLTRDDVEKIIEETRDGLELLAFRFVAAQRYDPTFTH